MISRGWRVQDTWFDIRFEARSPSPSYTAKILLENVCKGKITSLNINHSRQALSVMHTALCIKAEHALRTALYVSSRIFHRSPRGSVCVLYGAQASVAADFHSAHVTLTHCYLRIILGRCLGHRDTLIKPSNCYKQNGGAARPLSSHWSLL